MAKKNYKKVNFPKKSQEYIDDPNYGDPDLDDYIFKFNNEYYGNSLKKTHEGLKKQLHNTTDLVDQVYNQTNSRNRDLQSKLRVTHQIDTERPIENLSQSNEDKYEYLLKKEGYNNTLKEIFLDFSYILSKATTESSSLISLKLFYIEIMKLHREEKKWRVKENKMNRSNK